MGAITLVRRQVLHVLGGLVTTGLVGSTTSAADTGTLPVEVSIEDDAADLSISANEDFPGDPDEFLTDTNGLTIDIEVDDDSVTGFEDLLAVTNNSDDQETFILDGIDETGPALTMLGPNGDEVGGPDGTPIEAATTMPLSVVFDYTTHDEPLSVRLTLQLDNDEEDTDEDTGGGWGGWWGGGGLCAITTATHSQSPTLHSLRRFRDESLNQSSIGTLMVRIYELVGPPVARTLARHPDSQTTRSIRWLVRMAAHLSDRQRAIDNRWVSNLLAVFITAFYIIGVGIGIAGHLFLTRSQRLKRSSR